MVESLWAYERERRPPKTLRDKLNRSSKAAKRLALSLQALGPSLWLQALGDADLWAASLSIRAEPPRAGTGSALLDLVEDHSQSVRMLMHLSAEFAREAERIEPGKKGGNLRSDALEVGLRALLEVWWVYAPTKVPRQGKTPGSFGALASALFARPNFDFEPGTVKSAVAELLPLSAPARRSPECGT
jgi:hypothetical protein